ncbi:NADH-quinone oxidoreductase subunit I [Candidatus Chlorohelix sp.]|uniref:NuoI/complex I 23 kDa subunit family protein n=1 Tax=Candidatus Chlorohelix sp. TaxID=3139201 RepID=UPI003045C782
MANPFKATGNTFKGMGVTLKNIFHKPLTVQYPEHMRKLPPRERGRHVLHRYENGLERCIACMLCSGTCPADAIYIEPEENDPTQPVSFGERHARVFQIDILRCIFCGYCQAACPTGAITLESNNLLVSYTREKMLYNKEDLIEPKGTATRGAALAWEATPPPEARALIPDFQGLFDGWRTTAAAVGKGDLVPEASGQVDTPKPLRKQASLIPPGQAVPKSLPGQREEE